MIVIETVATPDRALSGAAKERVQKTATAMGRVRKRESGSKVFVVPSPIGLFPIRLSGKVHRNHRMISVPLHHGLCPFAKPVVQADTGRDLVAMSLVGRLQQRISQTSSEDQVRSQTPAVLRVHLAFGRLEIASEQFPGSKEVTGLVLVISLVRLSEKACNRSGGEIIGFDGGGDH